MKRVGQRERTITMRPSVWGDVSVESNRKKTGTLAGANFVTVGQGALRLKGPVGNVAANVKHRWKE